MCVVSAGVCMSFVYVNMYVSTLVCIHACLCGHLHVHICVSHGKNRVDVNALDGKQGTVCTQLSIQQFPQKLCGYHCFAVLILL